MQGIMEIYGKILPEYMIVKEDGSKYSSGISDITFDTLGIGFDTIRSSYFTWREATTTNRKELLELCWRQGHKYSTAMMNYKRRVQRSS